MKQKTIPVFVPHMGCPNDCSFCNQRKITGKEDEMSPQLARNQIEEALSTIESDYIEIGFFGGSFTGIEKEQQKQFLAIAKEYKEKNKIHAIRLSTRPDYIDEERLKLLKEFGVDTIELGAQSMDDEVLSKNRRGHTSKDTKRAAQLIKSYGFKLGLQMMTGLYGDTDEKCCQSAEEIITLRPDCVRIYPTLVLAGTYLDELYKKGEYTPQKLDDAIRLCADLKTRFDEEKIPVIRIGLMSSDNINPDKDVTAGPYHPSIGEMVSSEIYLRKILKEIDTDAEILVNKRDISAFVGNKKSNIQKLKEAGFSVTFKECDDIPETTYKIIRKEQRK